jgi:hypothetical protein
LLYCLNSLYSKGFQNAAALSSSVMGGGGSAVNVTRLSENRTRGIRDDLVIWLGSCLIVLSDDDESEQTSLEQVDTVSQSDFARLKVCLPKMCLPKINMLVTFLGLTFSFSIPSFGNLAVV